MREKKRVLVTGGLGGLGKHISKTLSDSGMVVKILDLNINKYARWFPKDCIFQGDITKPSTYRHLLSDLDAVIHTAFLVMPQVETDPRAYEINVGGTQTLIKELEQENPNCRFIFTSSVAVFGSTSALSPPIPESQEINPNDVYSTHKAECEKLITTSKLENWIILRLALAPYIEVTLSPKLLDVMLQTPADQRTEIIHVKDVALACKNAVSVPADYANKVYLIGGGSPCQIYYYDLIERLFEFFSLPPPPRAKFSLKPAGIDWYDTTHSQKILQYQTRTFDNYLEDVQKAFGRKKVLLRLMAPVSRMYMARSFQKLPNNKIDEINN
ncbi:MAG: NAD-dependent epimerase/dehydratase family protein [Candidatus Hodarchaeota archaeon]